MKYYKNIKTNEIHSYELDGSQDKFITTDFVKLSESEVDAFHKKNAPSLTDEQKKSLKRFAYEQESDPLFFKYQRGEATKAEWEAKILEIQKRFA